MGELLDVASAAAGSGEPRSSNRIVPLLALAGASPAFDETTAQTVLDITAMKQTGNCKLRDELCRGSTLTRFLS